MQGAAQLLGPKLELQQLTCFRTVRSSAKDEGCLRCVTLRGNKRVRR